MNNDLQEYEKQLCGVVKSRRSKSGKKVKMKAGAMKSETKCTEGNLKKGLNNKSKNNCRSRRSRRASQQEAGAMKLEKQKCMKEPEKGDKQTFTRA